MINKQLLQELAEERNEVCVTISLNTHRTHPENLTDEVTLKNFIQEAKDRVIAEFGKRSPATLLERLENLPSKIHRDYNLDSLHIYLSNDTAEIIQSIWPTETEGVHIGDRFALRPVIKAYVRDYDYFIMVLSQSGVHLYRANAASIAEEIVNEDFPFLENPHVIYNPAKASDGKQVDNMVREYFNTVDKTLVQVYNQHQLPCLVVCTEDNYSRLLQVANRPSIYLGYVPIDYNNTAEHQIAEQSWEFVRPLQVQKEKEAVTEVLDAAGNSLLLTDLQEIYRAAIDGRADLLVIQNNFWQSVQMTDERSFDLLDDGTAPGAIDDIGSMIVWEILSRNGRVVFIDDDREEQFGRIALKARY